MSSQTCTAPECTAAAVALVRLSVQPLEGYADPVEGHTRFAVCDEHLEVVEANEASMSALVPLLVVHVTRFA